MGVNLRLFYVLQLVCEGHLRSFVGKTYVRLRARIAFVYGQDLRSFVGNTCMRE